MNTFLDFQTLLHNPLLRAAASLPRKISIFTDVSFGWLREMGLLPTREKETHWHRE